MQRTGKDRKVGSPAFESQGDGSSFAGLQPNVGLLRQLKLFVELGAVRKTEEITAQQYTTKIRDLHKKLTKVGVAIPDHALALIMLRGLPMYRYEALVLRLARDEEKLSSVLVESRLVEEDMRIKRDSVQKNFISEESDASMHPLDRNIVITAQVHKTDQDENKIRRVQSQKEETSRTCRDSNGDRAPLGQKICRSCGDINLNTRNSPKFKEDRILEEKRTVNEDGDKENKKAQMCSCDQLKNCWILDSGAAEHGTFDKKHIENFEMVGGDICMANGAKLSVEGQGSVKLSLEEACGGGDIVLDSVRYIPELETNLISVGSLDENGMTLLIKDGRAEVQDGDKVLFTARNEHNVFVVKTKESSESWKDRTWMPQALTTGWRRFSITDDNEQRSSRSRLTSLWKY